MISEAELRRFIAGRRAAGRAADDGDYAVGQEAGIKVVCDALEELIASPTLITKTGEVQYRVIGAGIEAQMSNKDAAKGFAAMLPGLTAQSRQVFTVVSEWEEIR